MTMRTMPVEELRKLLSYDPDTGALTWLLRPREMFTEERIQKAWNSKCAGQAAFTAITAQGYHTGRIHREAYLAHRVLWALHYGEWPADQLDHINGCRTDNRICNLRAVNQTENNMNQKISTRNTSGYTGVGWFKRDSKWHAKINVHGKYKHLGYFDSIDEALVARTQAEIDYGFHENHGARR